MRDHGWHPALGAAVAAFEEVRGLPYAIDAAHDADALLELGSGDCLAKSDLLARRLGRLGLTVRTVRWLYLLPAVVREVEDLPDRLDLHRATEVRLKGAWVLVDATHDPALEAVGLTVGEWDAMSGTKPAYPPVGPRWVDGRDAGEIADAKARIRRWVESCPAPVLTRWRQAYIRCLREARRGTGG